MLPPEEAEEWRSPRRPARQRNRKTTTPDDPLRPRGRAPVLAQSAQARPIFFPLMLITVMLLGRDLSWRSRSSRPSC